MTAERPTVAILGGGQLGRLLALAGHRLGITCRLLDPAEDAPAQAVASCRIAAWDDPEALGWLAADAAVATWEVEHVPLAAVRTVQTVTPVRPDPQVLATVQDRAAQKQLLDRLGIPTAPWASPTSLAGLRAAIPALGLPVVMKLRLGGYDGRGQRIIRDESELVEAWEQLGRHGVIVEAMIAFDDECSLLSVRDRARAIRHYPLVKNLHRQGVLALTLAPHPNWSADRQLRAEGKAAKIMEALGYIGVMAVEFFRVGDRLLVNEIAPRVHNSGHWTLDGAECDQFENHLRAILGWPVGGTGLVQPCAMVNCLGSMPGPDVLAVPGLRRHDYGKTPRVGRKVGHLTVVAPTVAERDQRLAQLQRLMNAQPNHLRGVAE